MNEKMDLIIENYLRRLETKQTFYLFSRQQLHRVIKLNLQFLFFQLDKENTLKHEQLISILEKETIMETTYYIAIVESMRTFYQLTRHQRIDDFQIESIKEYPFTFKYWEMNTPYNECLLRANRSFKAIELSNNQAYVSSDKEVPGALGIEFKGRFKIEKGFIECQIRTMMIHHHWEIFSFDVREASYEKK